MSSELDTLLASQRTDEVWQQPAPPYTRGTSKVADILTFFPVAAPPESLVVFANHANPSGVVANEIPALRLHFDAADNENVTEVLTPLGRMTLNNETLLLTPVAMGWAVFDGAGNVRNIGHSKDAAPYVTAAAGSPTATSVLSGG